MANILILGGGFGGLQAAELLSEKLSDDHKITMVSPGSVFTFYPALVRVAFGDCEPADIRFSLTEKLANIGVRHIVAEVLEIRPKQKRVRVTGKDVVGEILYDYLIIATGRRLATECVPGFFEHSEHLLGVDAALGFGEEVKSFESGEIVVGLSPNAFLPVPVCETAFALANRFQKEMEDGKVSINVVFPGTIKEAFGGAEIHRELSNSFHSKGIRQITEFPIASISDSEVTADDGRKMSHDLLMLLPPFKGQAFLGKLDSTDEQEFVKTDLFLRVPNYPNIYAIGDVVAFPGPKLAYCAIQQAKVAAENVCSEVNGGEVESLYYHEIATVIDAHGPESLYLHYGVWDESLYRVRKGQFWGFAKRIHDKLWQARQAP